MYEFLVVIGDRELLFLGVGGQEHQEDDAARRGHTPTVACHLGQLLQRHAQKGTGKVGDVFRPALVLQDR